MRNHFMIAAVMLEGLILPACRSKSVPPPLTYTETSTDFGHITRTYFRGDTPVGESWGFAILSFAVCAWALLRKGAERHE